MRFVACVQCNSVPYCAISALSKNQKDEFWVRMLQSPHCDRLQVPYFWNVTSGKMFAGVTWTVSRNCILGRFGSYFRVYLCSPKKMSLVCLGPYFSVSGERVVTSCVVSKAVCRKLKWDMWPRTLVPITTTKVHRGSVLVILCLVAVTCQVQEPPVPSMHK